VIYLVANSPPAPHHTNLTSTHETRLFRRAHSVKHHRLLLYYAPNNNSRLDRSLEQSKSCLCRGGVGSEIKWGGKPTMRAHINHCIASEDSGESHCWCRGDSDHLSISSDSLSEPSSKTRIVCTILSGLINYTPKEPYPVTFRHKKIQASVC
jgi:hypothetical protein